MHYTGVSNGGTQEHSPCGWHSPDLLQTQLDMVTRWKTVTIRYGDTGVSLDLETLIRQEVDNSTRHGEALLK